MNRKSKKLPATSTVLTILFAASCNGSEPQDDDSKSSSTSSPAAATTTANVSPDARFWGRAMVKGQKGQLQQFDDKLKDLLGFTDLEEHEIGCIIGCDKFSGPDPLDRTVYVFPRDDTSVLSKFGETWDAIHKATLDPGFKMELETVIDAGDCDPVLEPPPCQDMPFCATDQCGKMVGGKPRCGAC